MIHVRSIGGWLLGVTLAACGPTSAVDGGMDATRTDAGTEAAGPDVPRIANAECLTCHTRVQTAWDHPSSHRQLLGCVDCHTQRDVEPGRGHYARPSCSTCHSEVAHPADAVCRDCHVPHGSANAFLIRTEIARTGGGTASIALGGPWGAAPGGLVSLGLPDGGGTAGLCEACHTRTRFYRRDGLGAAHETGFCGVCHDHGSGFARPADAGYRD